MPQVTNKFLAQMPSLTIKGNDTGSTANPKDLTVAQVNAILPIFTATLNGLVPFSSGGSTNFLRSDGTWAIPSAGVTSIGILDGQAANANGAAISAGVLYMQSADATHPGLVNTAAQTLAGAKTFSTAPIFSSLTASQALVLDASKNVASLAYTSTNTVSTIVSRDSSGDFSAGIITASLSGNATTATSATTATNATNVATTQVSTNASFFPLFVASSTNGNQAVDLGTGLTFNPSTNALSTTTFVGALTGTASGNTTITAANHAVVISSATNTLSTAAPSATSGVALVSNGSSADPSFGTVVIAGGGTGQTTKTAAFDALSPMTTAGDLILGGASGTGTRLAIGGNNTVLTSNGTTASWQAAASGSMTPFSEEILNLSLAVTASAGTMTIALKDQAGSDPSAGSAVKVGFRNATATTGTFSEVSITSALSATLAGATTLGAASAASYTVYVYLFNNAGTVTIGASLSLFDEGSLQSSSTTTTSNQVIYQSSALSSKPIRLIGRFVATNTTSSWGSPTEVSVQPFTKGVISARYTSAAGQSIAAGTTSIIDFGSKVYDTHNAVTTGASWKFTAPIAGKYDVETRVRWTSDTFTQGNQNYLYLYKNGSETSYIDNFQNQTTNTRAIFQSGSDTVQLAAGDTIDIRASQDESTARAFNASANRVTVCIARIGD